MEESRKQKEQARYEASVLNMNEKLKEKREGNNILSILVTNENKFNLILLCSKTNGG